MMAITQTDRFLAAAAGAGDWRSYYGQNSIGKWMVPYSVHQYSRIRLLMNAARLSLISKRQRRLRWCWWARETAKHPAAID
jgi:hypothetical protein